MTTPGLRTPIVERPRLFDLLDTSARCRLTIVDAHAGAGKTVLLTSWLERSRRSAVTWVRLETADNDPRVFWSYLLKALQLAPADPGRPTARTFREAVERHQGPLLIVLDRAQKLRDAAVLAELESVLLDTSADFRVVLSGRGRPVWPFPLLRARRELAEIGSAELAFTLPEAIEFFALAGLDLPPEQVASVLDRTGGGALDLDLAVRSARRGPGASAPPPMPGVAEALAGPERPDGRPQPSPPATGVPAPVVGGTWEPGARAAHVAGDPTGRPQGRAPMGSTEGDAGETPPMAGPGRHAAAEPGGRHVASGLGRHAAPVGRHAPSQTGGLHAAYGPPWPRSTWAS